MLRQRSICWQWLLGLGALLGVGLLAKFSIVGGILASGCGIVALAWRQPDRRIRTLLIYSAWTAGGLLLIAGWYLARNWLLYGDPSGVLIMAKYNVNPMRPYAPVGSFWQMLTTRRPGFVDLWTGLFHGFWGIFDFYIIWMTSRLYYCLDVLLVGGLVGTGIWGARSWLRRAEGSAQERLTLAVICCAITLVTLGLILNYSYRIDYQPQGRYLLPVLAPLALATVTGWEQILRLIKLQRLAAPLLIILMLSAKSLALFTAVARDYPQVWQPGKGDGVEFIVQLDVADGRHELLRRYIDPKRRPADRRWHDIAVDLSAYAGQPVRLTLLTLPGPAGDGRYDWAGWGEPVIVTDIRRGHEVCRLGRIGEHFPGLVAVISSG